MKLRHLLPVMLCLSASFAVAKGPTLVERIVERTTNAPCVNDADCSQHGICESNGQCKCDKGHVTHNNGKPCAYTQKSRIAALILEITLGLVGGGDFYLERYGWAAGKLTLFGSFLLLGTCSCTNILLIAPWAGAAACFADVSTCGAGVSGAAAVVSGAAATVAGALAIGTIVGDGIWSIVSIVRIATGEEEDGNGEKTRW